VRELDSERAEREERRRGEPCLPRSEAARDPVDEKDREEVEDPRQKPAHQIRAVVAAPADDRRRASREKHRERAVDERAVTPVVRIERRILRVEVAGEASGRAEVVLHHRDETLVRVKVVPLVPVELLESEERARGENREQNRAGGRSAQKRVSGGELRR
jgi:hypothetical protein